MSFIWRNDSLKLNNNPSVLIGITISVWNFSSHPDWCQDWQQGEYTRPVASCPSRLHFLFWQNPGSLAVHPVLKPQHPRESNNNSLGQFLAWFSVSINVSGFIYALQNDNHYMSQASFSYMGLDIPFIIGPEVTPILAYILYLSSTLM